MFAEDKGWHKRIAEGIASGMTAEAAVERAFEEMKDRFADTTDSYLKERLHDLRDVSDRLLSYQSGDEGGLGNKASADEDIIVVAKTMGPADLMDYDHTRIRGLLIEDGTPTMHVVIVAKALNIPVISKTKGLFNDISSGQLIALDGEEGMVYLSPDASVQKLFKRKIAEAKELAEKFKALRGLPAKTLDGVKVGLYINVGLSFDLEYLEPTNCDGIGLYRTEIPFMSAAALPGVDEQAGYYRELFDRAKGKRIIFRSLDAGSDKLLPYWSGFNEENPAIGWRSIRITLDRRMLLRKQLRAFLKAAAGR
jgi:phosphotransferase system enzyme I (PtsP)